MLVAAPPQIWRIDVTPPSMSILQNDGEPVIPCASYNGGRRSWEEWWNVHLIASVFWLARHRQNRMVDGPDLISGNGFCRRSDAEIILHLPAKRPLDLRSPPNAPSGRLASGWAFSLNGADGFIHHGGAQATL